MTKTIWKPTVQAGQPLSAVRNSLRPVPNGKKLAWSESKLCISVTRTIPALFVGVLATNHSAVKHQRRCTSGSKIPTSQDLFTLNVTEHRTKKNFRMFKAKCTQNLGSVKNMHSRAETADRISSASTHTQWAIPAVQQTNTPLFGTNILACKADLFGIGLTKA